MPRGCAPTSREFCEGRGPTAFCRSRWSRSTTGYDAFAVAGARKYYRQRGALPRALPRGIVGAIRLPARIRCLCVA